MSDVFEIIREGLLRGASSIAETGSKALERGKLRAILFRLEDAEKEKLGDLGEICYRMHCGETEDTGEMKTICEQLDAINKEILEIRKQMERPDQI